MKLCVVVASCLLLTTAQCVQEPSSSGTGMSSQVRNRRQGFLTSVLSRFNSGINIFMNSADFQALKAAGEPKKPLAPYNAPAQLFKGLDLGKKKTVESIPFAKRLQDALFQRGVTQPFPVQPIKTLERERLRSFANSARSTSLGKSFPRPQGPVFPPQGVKIKLAQLQQPHIPFSASIKQAPVSHQQVQKSLRGNPNGFIVKSKQLYPQVPVNFQNRGTLSGYNSLIEQQQQSNSHLRGHSSLSSGAFRAQIVQASKTRNPSPIVQGFEISNAIKLVEGMARAQMQAPPKLVHNQISDIGGSVPLKSDKNNIQAGSQSERAETFGTPPGLHFEQSSPFFAPQLQKHIPSYGSPNLPQNFPDPTAIRLGGGYGAELSGVFPSQPILEGYGEEIRSKLPSHPIEGSYQGELRAEFPSHAIPGGYGGELRAELPSHPIGGGYGGKLRAEFPSHPIGGGDGGELRAEFPSHPIGGGYGGELRAEFPSHPIGGGYGGELRAEFPSFPAQGEHEDGGGFYGVNHKHVFVHAGLEEEPQLPGKVFQPPIPPEIHHQIIFVKAPGPIGQSPTVVELPPPPETKTQVYVLVKQKEVDEDEVRVVAPPPTAPAPPEVYFIRYAHNAPKYPISEFNKVTSDRIPAPESHDLYAPQMPHSNYNFKREAVQETSS